MEIIDDIPVRLPLGEIRRQLHLDKDKRWEEVQTLIGAAQPLITPKAAYKVSYINQKLEHALDIDAVRFTSKVLRKNLEEVERVFPYVITIGDKLKEKGSESKDLIKEYYFDVIGNIALSATRKFLEKQLQSRYGLDGMSFMSPGSLTDWPIEEQKPLFSLFGEEATPVGVKLTQHLLMLPAKSISGIYFPTEVSFFSCQLCPRDNCPGRKAAYDNKLAKEYGIL
jgi:vacuolar-type H+-ATPase subunit F/Vma7